MFNYHLETISVCCQILKTKEELSGIMPFNLFELRIN
jgi:hypothetical protein